MVVVVGVVDVVVVVGGTVVVVDVVVVGGTVVVVDVVVVGGSVVVVVVVVGGTVVVVDVVDVVVVGGTVVVVDVVDVVVVGVVVVGVVLAWEGLVDGPEGPDAVAPLVEGSPWSGCSSRMLPACRSRSFAVTWVATRACSAPTCPCPSCSGGPDAGLLRGVPDESTRRPFAPHPTPLGASTMRYDRSGHTEPASG